VVVVVVVEVVVMWGDRMLAGKRNLVVVIVQVEGNLAAYLEGKTEVVGILAAYLEDTTAEEALCLDRVVEHLVVKDIEE